MRFTKQPSNQPLSRLPRALTCSCALPAKKMCGCGNTKSPKGFCDGSHATATAAPTVRFSLLIMIHTTVC